MKNYKILYEEWHNTSFKERADAIYLFEQSVNKEINYTPLGNVNITHQKDNLIISQALMLKTKK